MTTPTPADIELPALPDSIVSTAPDRIWLDIGDAKDFIEPDDTFTTLMRGETTWSEDNATGCGIEYVRADRARTAASCAATQAEPVPVVQPVAAEAMQTDDASWTRVLRERDNCERWADKLADKIAHITGVDIGEHSSANNPWREALDAEVPEGCTPADARKLREANHALAVEVQQMRRALWAVLNFIDGVKDAPEPFDLVREAMRHVQLSSCASATQQGDES